MFYRYSGRCGARGAGRGWDWRFDQGFGPFSFGGPRRGGHWRGARFFEQGGLKFVILRLLDEKPRHGYEIIKALERLAETLRKAAEEIEALRGTDHQEKQDAGTK